MQFVKSYQVTEIPDLVNKVKACETLGLSYRLGGTLKEFIYDVIDGNILGSLSSTTERVSYLRDYGGFNEDDITVRFIRVNDDPYLPKEDVMVLHVLEWQNRFFILDDTNLEVYTK